MTTQFNTISSSPSRLYPGNPVEGSIRNRQNLLGSILPTTSDLLGRVNDLLSRMLRDIDSESSAFSASFSSSSSALSASTTAFPSVFSSNSVNSISSDISSDPCSPLTERQKKRKREEEEHLETNIGILEAMKKEVHQCDLDIEWLKRQRQQKIDEYNQASRSVHEQALSQGKIRVPDFILSPEDSHFL